MLCFCSLLFGAQLTLLVSAIEAHGRWSGLEEMTRGSSRHAGIFRPSLCSPAPGVSEMLDNKNPVC